MEKELQQLSTALDELHKSNDVSDAAYSTLKFAVLQLKNCNLQNVNGSCYMCGKTIERPEEQLDMYGEIVCQDCWDYNMYQALQDGGGM